MIIIDGPDGSGKSTLVEFIKKNSSVSLVKPFYPKKDQLNYYLQTPATYSPFYLERYYISELVYPQFKTGRKKMEPWHQQLIEAGIMPFYPIILYVRPDKETIFENIKKRGDDYINLDEIDSMIYFYDKVIENTYLPVYTYDYKKHNIKSLLELIENDHEKRKQKALKLQKFLSSGNYYQENSIMFIGEMPSNFSIGKGFIRTFISNTGSSEFFHHCLYNIGMKQMPYFTNWNKCEDNDILNRKALEEEIEILKPKKIIFLGKSLKEKFGEGEYISHPAYIKRFKSNQYEEYIEEIKEKIR